MRREIEVHVKAVPGTQSQTVDRVFLRGKSGFSATLCQFTLARSYRPIFDCLFCVTCSSVAAKYPFCSHFLAFFSRNTHCCQPVGELRLRIHSFQSETYVYR
jgi:hypothetical protein